MNKIKSLADLQQMKNNVQSKINLRERSDSAENLVQIRVSMGTCGIASGAKQTMDFLIQELDKCNIPAVVTQTGCMGYCFAEPTVEVTLTSKDPIVYGKVDAQKAGEIIEASEKDFCKISSQKTPQGVLALFQKPNYSYNFDEINTQLSLALDDVQDPGNLGTIIRIADWFGIRDIFCSLHTADVYGAKTVQATMGALARVRVHYVNLADFLRQCSERELPVYGTFMNGENIYSEKNLSKNGIIVMGNEGNGIAPEIEKYVSKPLLIPNFPQGETTSESLNVSIATALVCAEFRRRIF